jgi:hypothetical protein
LPWSFRKLSSSPDAAGHILLQRRGQQQEQPTAVHQHSSCMAASHASSASFTARAEQSPFAQQTAAKPAMSCTLLVSGAVWHPRPVTHAVQLQDAQCGCPLSTVFSEQQQWQRQPGTASAGRPLRATAVAAAASDCLSRSASQSNSSGSGSQRLPQQVGLSEQQQWQQQGRPRGNSRCGIRPAPAFIFSISASSCSSNSSGAAAAAATAATAAAQLLFCLGPKHE